MGPMPVSPRKGIAGLLFKQYPGQQQVDLKVKVDIPGSWFSAGQSGGLTAAERKEKYESIAMEYEEKHVFEPAAGRKPALVKEGIRFVCPTDAADDADHPGFWIELTKWNRYRNDTYKDRREDEVRATGSRTVAHLALMICAECAPTSARRRARGAR
jgi:hypothetical protein